MIITFATQKGGVGKTTLAIAFSNYLALEFNRKVKVFDFDYQKSFYNRWKEDEGLGLEKLYDVELIDTSIENPVSDFDNIQRMKESEDIFIFDLAGTLDADYIDILMESDFIIVPIEYSDVSVKSTMIFNNLMGKMDSSARLVYIRSRYDKNYNYRNQETMDVIYSRYGKVLKEPVYKRNILQYINTRALPYEEKREVKKTFDELICYIEESLETKFNRK